MLPGNTSRKLKKDIRIALVSCESRIGKVEDNLKKLIGFVNTARKNNVRIVCFPEMQLTGYLYREDHSRYAIPAEHFVIDEIRKLAKDWGIVVLTGFGEKDPEGWVYSTHAVFGPAGSGWYRKMHIAPIEKELLTQGDSLPIFSAWGVRFGIQLCYDAHFPGLSTRMAEAGVDVVFFPHASPRGTPEKKLASWSRHLPARAFDNGLFVAACNSSGENGKGLHFPGVAVVFSPTGYVLEKMIPPDEAMLIADLSAEILDNVRNHHMRYFLPNRRRDISNCETRLTIVTE